MQIADHDKADYGLVVQSK